MDSKLWISLNPASNQVQKHSETALDTLKNGGTESSFPIKVHAIPGKTPAICEFLVLQMCCKNQKKNRKPLKINGLRLCVPGAEAPLLLYIEV